MILFIAIFIGSFETSKAQKFNKAFSGFSKQKLAYVEMQDGSKKQGYLKSIKREEGLFKIIRMKEKTTEADLEINAINIKKMYLAPSNYAKIEGVLIKDDVVNSWGEESEIDTNLIKEGYVCFERVPTQLEDSKIDVMLQLLNPHFCSKIKIYYDPFSSGGLVSVGGIDVVGGERSYYIRKRTDLLAFKLNAWEYEDYFKTIFGDCADFMQKYSEDIIWLNFEKHVYEYTILMK
ncbi:MAG: hypothetical protein EAZ55_14380 [Cytophagales bacterium]|nr:MAG: hypothetical protein EAZ55_14380 [Cytophagales bacterium]